MVDINQDHAETVAFSGGEFEVLLERCHVITSYSIHYTKLYEGDCFLFFYRYWNLENASIRLSLGILDLFYKFH